MPLRMGPYKKNLPTPTKTHYPYKNLPTPTKPHHPYNSLNSPKQNIIFFNK